LRVHPQRQLVIGVHDQQIAHREGKGNGKKMLESKDGTYATSNGTSKTEPSTHQCFTKGAYRH